MDYGWAFPFGHEDLTLDPIIGRTFYQPVQDRDDAIHGDGHSFGLDPALNQERLYSMVAGVATYSFDFASGSGIGELSVEVDSDFANKLRNTAYFRGVTLKKIVYGNINHTSFLYRISNLIDFIYTNTHNFIFYTITTTPWRGDTLRAALGPVANSPTYVNARTNFISDVLTGMPFKIGPTDLFGDAGPKAANEPFIPSTHKMVRITVYDSDDRPIDFRMVLDSLVSSSYGRMRLNVNFPSLTAIRPNPHTPANLYDTPLLQKMGVTKDSVSLPTQPQLPPRPTTTTPPTTTPPTTTPPTTTPPTTTPPTTTTPTTTTPPTTTPTPAPAGCRDIVLDKSLFDWHHGPDNSLIEYRYNEQDNMKFEVRLRDPNVHTLPYTVTKYKKENGKIVKDANGKAVTIREQVNFEVITTRPATPLPAGGNYAYVYPQANARQLATYEQRAVSLYRRNQTLIDNLAYYLGVPSELLVAVTYHESAGLSYPIRFEVLRNTANLPKDFVDKYKAMTEPNGRSVTLNLRVPANRSRVIYTIPVPKTKANPTPAPSPLNMTWQEYLDVIDQYRLGAYVHQRISPGLAQTLITTAYSALQYVQRLFAKRPDILAQLGLTNVPNTPSALIYWLLEPTNSLVAGAAYLAQRAVSTTSTTRKGVRRVNRGSQWDLPKVGSYYNDNGVHSNKYYSTKKPNPWGVLLNDEQYNLDVMIIYNLLRDPAVLRRNNIQFQGCLKKSTK